ncbi:MAG: hypothetical protein WDM78_12095 [Puia sp.]
MKRRDFVKKHFHRRCRDLAFQSFSPSSPGQQKQKFAWALSETVSGDKIICGMHCRDQMWMS